MEGRSPEGHIQDWDETDVHNWFSSLGYPQYEQQIRDNTIRGDSLCVMNAEHLKQLGVASVGQRLSILKSIYLVKIAHNVPIEEDHYVPPSESPDRSENMTVDKLNSMLREQAQRLRAVEDENRTLTTTLQSFIEDFSSFRSSLSRPDDPQDPLRRQPSFKWASFPKGQKSPTKAEASESPHPSPQRAEHDLGPYAKTPGPSGPSSQQATSNGQDKTRSLQPPPSEGPAPQQRPGRQESSDNLKSFRVSLEDPTWKVLPAALKKYRINNDNWQNYAMFICYGSPGNRIDRCLSYDEKPLLLFQKLKDARKNPVFMLKHIKDIRSPIAVAQQKHAARKASSVISQETTATSGHIKGASTSRSVNRPPKLEVQDLSASTPITSTALSPQPNWPEASLLSPAVDSQKTDDPNATLSNTTSTSSHLTPMSGTTLVSQADSGKGRSNSDHSEGNGRDLQTIQPSSGVSYAVAIYPYMAEQEDEFDVVVGDTFVIVSRARGWWVVQRDPTGSGTVDPDTSKQGWVPAGCLLETNVPVAAAIAEAVTKNGTANNSDGDGNARTPILPLSIISTSFPGVALMDYKKKGEEELDLVKDDALRVFKRYNHWSYAVKEVGGDRGWVPSWFIGKVLPNGVTPATPGSGIPPLPLTSTSHLEDGPNQVSPMSSAFPSVPTARSGSGLNAGI